MELSSSIFSDILTPLAIYADDTTSKDVLGNPGTEKNSFGHAKQSNRVATSSSTATQTPYWRLDGIDIDGIRFFAVPTFALGTPPMRVDVYIPPPEEHSREVREMLEPEAAMYTTDKQSALNLPISQHLLLALAHWSSSLPDFEELYLSLPFGSQIIVSELNLDPVATSSTIQLVPNYAVEQAMAPVDSLQSLWPSSITWPPTIDTTSLALLSQIHEAITLVTIPSSPHPTSTYVFKSLLRDQKYLYNELKMLLTLPPHPNLIPRPVHVVTHKCRFGGKRGVAGFVLEYYPLGSLASNLSSSPSSSSSFLPTTPSSSFPSLSDRFRWARQVASALIHVNRSGGFYPDLKPDNVVLRQQRRGSHTAAAAAGQSDAVLLDLEQRGGWFSWSPPEVAYVEYVEILASRGPPELSSRPHDLRDEMTRLLRRYIPTWEAPPARQEERYVTADAEGGFSAPWLALARLRRDDDRPYHRGWEGAGAGAAALGTLLERAQSFMLGKLLWCIFEGRAAVRCGIDHELLRDPDAKGPGFPAFRKTPEGVRELIRACTAGAGEWDGRGRGIELRAGRLVPVAWDREGGAPSGADTRQVARQWWMGEVEAARGFMDELTGVINGEREVRGGVLAQALSRPLLSEVLAELTRIEQA